MAAAADKGSADTLREAGNDAFRAGDYLKAAAAYTRAIKAEPESAVLYSNRALALLKLNKLAKALADAEQCTRLDPSFVKGWYRHAQVLETQGNLEQAVAVLKQGCDATADDQELPKQLKVLMRKIARDQGRQPATVSAGSALENGGKAPASRSEAEALAFADAWLTYAQEQIQEHGTDFPPTVHFLPGEGTNTPAQQQPTASILGANAYADPATLSEFVNFVRSKGEELKARAVISIVPKSKVAFPQTWISSLWPYSREQDGVFVQLQAICPQTTTAAANGKSSSSKATKTQSGARRQPDATTSADGDQARGGAVTQLAKVWFLRLGDRVEGVGFKARTPHELPQDLSLMPSLLR